MLEVYVEHAGVRPGRGQRGGESAAALLESEVAGLVDDAERMAHMAGAHASTCRVPGLIFVLADVQTASRASGNTSLPELIEMTGIPARSAARIAGASALGFGSDTTRPAGLVAIAARISSRACARCRTYQGAS